MKPTKAIAVMTVVALGVAGAGQLYAETQKAESSAGTEVSQQVSGGPQAKDQIELSEHGLAAINDIHLARVAVNDGYVDNARNLLKEARTLLDQVKSEDKPIKVQTDVRRDGKEVEHQTQSVTADMIPIMSEMQVVESYSLANAKSAKGSAETASSQGKTAQNSPAASASAKTDQAEARTAAVAKANAHLSQGDRGAAAEALRLVDLALVDQTVSMPLAETTQSVDRAIQFIDQDKLHEANLELKQVRDGLVLTTHVVAAPVGTTKTSPSPKAG
ncbi:YfdX family protein [Thiocystis violacea]|uniref:YfdX family protein n=1 Tax=Thiocystis violacea TaxID=13725 RepID=UPI0019035FEA|nr:YfdX family protein [Thiocystis violacea]MBK1723444.1 hypothetical protein [Thiocystis violacea]